MDRLKGIFWRGWNNDVGISGDGEICAVVAGAAELTAAGGEMKQSIWRFDSHDFSESK
ncbi:Uncharacterized protein BM_BM617 [Brugia malayi]|uniref:Bm617 n=2 Tax=Brugia malayi TaxID=6279 RepID=A0A0J9Y0C8_BRUMA|nr:Uncharacterized protein BM_BM617 [Brugia malayi]CDP99176.1 Bm617 [Brugia malayi]VIO91217.1 Uncharacterized protein BM_BM617 [Brugia malayi]